MNKKRAFEIGQQLGMTKRAAVSAEQAALYGGLGGAGLGAVSGLIGGGDDNKSMLSNILRKALGLGILGAAGGYGAVKAKPHVEELLAWLKKGLPQQKRGRTAKVKLFGEDIAEISGN